MTGELAFQIAASPPGAPDQPAGAVFLCHNNQDKPAVKRIADGLELEFGTPFFLDAYAIPTGERFLPYIERSLAGCFGCAIFLGANGWGPTHLWEAELALARYRADPAFRLIPVALPGIRQEDIRRLGSGKLFQEVNWADFSRSIDDADSLKKLGAAITGQALPQHRGPARLTPYQIRRDAARWAASARRETSILYRGEQLAEANALMRGNPDLVVLDEVLPFLTAAEERQRRFLRRTAAGGALGTVVFLVLFVVTYVAYELAEQRRLASLSRQLAIASREAPGPDRTLLISAQAVATAKTPEALGNLLERLEEWRFLRRVIHLNAGVEALAFRTEDGEVLAGLTDGGLAHWGPGAATPQPRPPPRPGESGIRALAVMGTQLWIGRTDGRVEIEDEGTTSIVLPASSVASGTDRRVLAIAGVAVEGGKQRLVAVGTAAGRLLVLDARTLDIRAAFDEASELRVTTLAQDPSGRWLAAGTDAGTVLFLELATLELRQRYPRIEGGVLAIGFDAEGRLAVVSGYGSLYILREEGGEFRREASRQLAGLPASAAVDGPHGRLALGDASGMVRLYDLLGEPLAFGALRGHGNAVSALAFAGEGSLVSASSDGTVAVWDLSGASGPSTAMPSFGPEPGILRADSRGGLRAASAVEGQAGVWRLEGGVWTLETDLLQVTRTAAGAEALLAPPEAASSPSAGLVRVGEPEITALAMDRIGTAVVWATRGGFVLRLPLREPKYASVLAAGERGLGDIASSADGSVLAFATEEGRAVVVIRPEKSGVSRQSLRLPRTKTVRALALDGKGTTAAVGFEDGTITLFDAVTGAARHEAFRVHTSPVAGLLFAATGRDLISFGSGGGGADRTIAITDLRNPSAARRLQARQAGGSVSALSTSRGSGLLAAGDHDGQILLWRLEDRRFVAQLPAGRSYVPGLLLDDAESRLVSVSSDGSFLSWNMDPTHWVALACVKANRSLRRDEWMELLPDDRYAPICGASGEATE